MRTMNEGVQAAASSMTGDSFSSGELLLLLCAGLGVIALVLTLLPRRKK